MLKLAFVSWLLNEPNVFWYGMIGAFGLFLISGLCAWYCKSHKSLL